MDSGERLEDQEQGGGSEAGLARRRLLKAALGTTAAVAAYTAPKVSVVPAYGLTSSNRFNGLCYGLAWSSNNPTGKGWMSVSNQDKEFSGPALPPTTGPASDQGTVRTSANPQIYRWTIAAFNGIPAFTLQIDAWGCVNAGTGQWQVSGMPTGYCLVFYNNGRAYDKNTNVNTCGGQTSGLLPAGNSQASPVTAGNGDIISFSAQPGYAGNCSGSGFGKISWTFDIKPCP